MYCKAKNWFDLNLYTMVTKTDVFNFVKQWWSWVTMIQLFWESWCFLMSVTSSYMVLLISTTFIWGSTESPRNHLNACENAIVDFWMAIIFHGGVAFDISPQIMNAERYCSILNEKVIPNMVSSTRRTWYQQDGAPPPHFSFEARRILNNFLPGRWIGRWGAIEWPPRSRDLTPADFWLWSLKPKFLPSWRSFQSLDELREKI